MNAARSRSLQRDLNNGLRGLRRDLNGVLRGLQRGGKAELIPAKVRTIAIVGSGLIGAGWAAWFLAQGFDVRAQPLEAKRRLALVPDDPNQDQFLILGMRANPDRLDVKLVPNEPLSGQFELRFSAATGGGIDQFFDLGSVLADIPKHLTRPFGSTSRS